jgi:hypothetical protein
MGLLSVSWRLWRGHQTIVESAPQTLLVDSIRSIRATDDFTIDPPNK